MILSMLRAAATTVLVYLLHHGLVVPPRLRPIPTWSSVGMATVAHTDCHRTGINVRS